jgi:hypothetical protein
LKKISLALESLPIKGLGVARRVDERANRCTRGDRCAGAQQLSPGHSPFRFAVSVHALLLS